MGYNIKNWEDFRAEIIEKAALNPAYFQREDKHGAYYNVPMILYGKKNNPMDVVVTWEIKNGVPRLVTAFPNDKEDLQWNTTN